MMKQMGTFMKQIKEEQLNLSKMETTINEHSGSIEFTNKQISDFGTKVIEAFDSCMNVARLISDNETDLLDTVKKMSEEQQFLKTSLSACKIQ